MRSVHALLVLLLVTGLFSAGCMTPGPARETGQNPTVTIVTPEFDGGVYTGDVSVEIRVTNFTLGSSGHAVYYRDVVPPVETGRPALTGPGTSAVSDATIYTWHNVTPGTHTFSTQLVHLDNTPFSPPVLDAVDVTAVPPGDIAGQ